MGGLFKNNRSPNKNQQSSKGLNLFKPETWDGRPSNQEIKVNVGIKNTESSLLSRKRGITSTVLTSASGLNPFLSVDEKPRKILLGE